MFSSVRESFLALSAAGQAGNAPETRVPVEVPAGLHGACSGDSRSRNLGNNHGEAFRALRAIQAHVNPHICGGKTSLEGENSSSICYVTFFVYFLTMASQTEYELLNSEVAGSILAVFPVKAKKKSSHLQEAVNSPTYRKQR